MLFMKILKDKRLIEVVPRYRVNEFQRKLTEIINTQVFFAINVVVMRKEERMQELNLMITKD